jgi:hypothetical protein
MSIWDPPFWPSSRKALTILPKEIEGAASWKSLPQW